MEEKEKLDIQELIKVEALPKIFYQLEEIGKRVDQALYGIENMECNESNKKEVKRRKQDITAFKNLMEDRRKEIKKQVMSKYNEFNEKYEIEVKDKLVNAESILKEKYEAIENEQKKVMENKIRLFANEHIIANNLQDIIKFEDINLNITLSATEKSLKEQARAFIESKANDIKLIEMEEYKDEILLEYKNNLDFASSKLTVITRHKQLEEMKSKTEELTKAIKQEEKKEEEIKQIVAEEEELTTPKEIDEDVNCYGFKVYATNTQIKELIEFMKGKGIKYE